MSNYRERCSVALMRAWNRRAVVCAHTQRVPIGELVDAVLAVPNPELEKLRGEVSRLRGERDAARATRDETHIWTNTDWKERAERAQAALARVRAGLDRLCHEPHPRHDHSCPDDVRRTLLAAIEGTDSDH